MQIIFGDNICDLFPSVVVCVMETGIPCVLAATAYVNELVLGREMVEERLLLAQELTYLSKATSLSPLLPVLVRVCIYT